MSRVSLVEGTLDDLGGEEGFDHILELASIPSGDAAALREALSHALRRASRARASRVALAPDAQALGFPTQAFAEILIESLRAAPPGNAAPDEVHLVLEGEPTYRIYEAVHDAARIAEQMRRLQGA